MKLESMPDDEPIVLDGQPDMIGGTEITSSNFSGLLSVRVFKRGRDLYLYARTKKTSKVSLNFSGSRYYGKTLFKRITCIVVGSETAFLLNTSEKTIELGASNGNSKGAIFTNDRGEQVVEVELSSVHLNAITTNQIFWIGVSPEFTSTETGSIKVSGYIKFLKAFIKLKVR